MIRYVLDASQELRAIGLGNVVSSVFQSFPVTGSFSRTAVNSASNAQTPASGLFTGLIVMFALLALTSTFAYIPKAALAAIIMMSVVRMVDVAHIRSIWRTKPSDMVVWLTSFLLCLLWSLEFGIIASILLSFVVQEVRTSCQPLLRLTESTDTGTGGSWHVDDTYNTKGLSQQWGPMFTGGTVESGTIVVRVAGKLTFSMCRSGQTAPPRSPNGGQAGLVCCAARTAHPRGVHVWRNACNAKPATDHEAHVKPRPEATLHTTQYPAIYCASKRSHGGKHTRLNSIMVFHGAL